MSEEVKTRLKAKVWLTSQEASDLMTEIHGREISTAYVRLLGRRGLLKTQMLDKRTNLYSKRDCENYHVDEHPGRETGRAQGRPRRAQQGNDEKQSEETPGYPAIAD